MKNLCIALLLSAMVCTVGCKGESTEAGDDVKSTETAGGDAVFDLATAELPDVLPADTPTAEVDEEVADEVCCQLGNIFKFLPTAECVAEEGVETTPENCQVAPPDCTSDKDCDDGNVCTQDDCKNSVCDNTPLTGPACDDGDDCTENDACAAGACAGELKVECQPSICCFLDGIHAEATEAGCLEEGGAPLPIDLCEDVCCEKNGELSIEMSVDCETFGMVKDAADCEVVCCEMADWQLAMKKAGECEEVVDPMWCIGEVCCEVDLEPVMVPVDECKPPKGTPLPPGECGDVCCLVGEDAAVEPSEDCEAEGGQQFAQNACEPECCHIGDLYYEAPALVCDKFGETADVDSCELLCCPWGDGQYFYDNKGNCMFAAAAEDNCVDSPVCCDLGNGPEKMMADDCIVPKGSPLPAEDCGPICCKTDSEVLVTLGDECEAKNGDMYKQELCDVICCLTAADASYGNFSKIQCDDVGAAVAEEHCEPVCCLDNTGAWLTTKGNCVIGNALPPEKCAVVCCLDGESPGPKPASECQNTAPWSQCPGQCNEDADCGPPTCGVDFEMIFGWSCVEQECQQVETACEAPQKCLAGQCTDTLENEFGVNGTCNNNYATFKPGIEWETIKAIRLTVTYNTISCCATSGCGSYDSEVGPQPCGYPILVNTFADQVDVDVSKHEGNVGESYVLSMDGPTLSGKYTDTWCGDNYAYDGPWATIKPSVTWFMVTAFQQVCCKLPNGQFGFEDQEDCANPASLAACTLAEVCCPAYSGPQFMSAVACFEAGLKPVAADLCQEEVCCVDGAGTSAALVTGEQCNSTGGIAMPSTLCGESCCKTEGTYMTMPDVFCLEDGTILDDSKCEQTCCIDTQGSTWGEMMLKGECDEKFWSYFDYDLTYCDPVCCMIPDGPKFWVKYLCNGKETSWDNCPGKCGKAEDCGAPHCKEGVDDVAVDWVCDAEYTCQTEEETCPGEGGFCAGGICFE